MSLARETTTVASLAACTKLHAHTYIHAYTLLALEPIVLLIVPTLHLSSSSYLVTKLRRDHANFHVLLVGDVVRSSSKGGHRRAEILQGGGGGHVPLVPPCSTSYGYGVFCVLLFVVSVN